MIIALFSATINNTNNTGVGELRYHGGPAVVILTFSEKIAETSGSMSNVVIFNKAHKSFQTPTRETKKYI